MTLRETLEAIWNDSKVRCPKHIVWWGREDIATIKMTAVQASEPLFYAKGRRVELIRPDRGIER